MQAESFSELSKIAHDFRLGIKLNRITTIVKNEGKFKFVEDAEAKIVELYNNLKLFPIEERIEPRLSESTIGFFLVWHFRKELEESIADAKKTTPENF